MRQIVVIGLKDLRLRLRDRSAIVVSFLAPLILATIISFAFQEEGAFRTSFAIADLDGSPLSSSLERGLREIPAFADAITLEVVGTEIAALDLLDKHTVSAALVIPEGFGTAVENGEEASIKVLRSVESPIGGTIAQAIADGFVAELNAGRLSIQSAVAAGALRRPGSNLPVLIEKAASERIPAVVTDGQVAAREVNAASYFAPGMAIFFLFFTVQFGALGIIAERREGTLQRLLAAPMRTSQIVAGKLFSSFVLGCMSMVTMVFATRALLGAEWGDPLAVAGLSAAIVLAAMGVTGLVIALAKTQEQAAGYASIAAIGLSLLGGNFIQITDAPWIIQKISLLTPNGWALRGFFDLAAEGGGVASIAPALAAVLAFAAVTGGAGLLLGRRLVAS